MTASLLRIITYIEILIAKFFSPRGDLVWTVMHEKLDLVYLHRSFVYLMHKKQNLSLNMRVLTQI